MRPALILALALVLSGCSVAGLGAAGPATPTPSPTAAPVPPPTAAATPRPRPTPTPVIGRQYAAFLRAICAAFARKDAGVIIQSLPYYEYNSGLRYGYLGDGEGQSGDPSLARSWLSSGRVRCEYFTPDLSGHGTVLTSGWPLPNGPWSLIEMDIFSGRWKINDFTFGRSASLYQSMQQTSGPVLRYGR